MNALSRFPLISRPLSHMHLARWYRKSKTRFVRSSLLNNPCRVSPNCQLHCRYIYVNRRRKRARAEGVLAAHAARVECILSAVKNSRRRALSLYHSPSLSLYIYIQVCKCSSNGDGLHNVYNLYCSLLSLTFCACDAAVKERRARVPIYTPILYL